MELAIDQDTLDVLLSLADNGESRSVAAQDYRKSQTNNMEEDQNLERVPLLTMNPAGAADVKIVAARSKYKRKKTSLALAATLSRINNRGGNKTASATGKSDSTIVLFQGKAYPIQVATKLGYSSTIPRTTRRDLRNHYGYFIASACNYWDSKLAEEYVCTFFSPSSVYREETPGKLRVARGITDVLAQWLRMYEEKVPDAICRHVSSTCRFRPDGTAEVVSQLEMKGTQCLMSASLEGYVQSLVADSDIQRDKTTDAFARQLMNATTTTTTAPASTPTATPTPSIPSTLSSHDSQAVQYGKNEHPDGSFPPSSITVAAADSACFRRGRFVDSTDTGTTIDANNRIRDNGKEPAATADGGGDVVRTLPFKTAVEGVREEEQQLQQQHRQQLRQRLQQQPQQQQLQQLEPPSSAGKEIEAAAAAAVGEAMYGSAGWKIGHGQHVMQGAHWTVSSTNYCSGVVSTMPLTLAVVTRMEINREMKIVHLDMTATFEHAAK